MGKNVLILGLSVALLLLLGSVSSAPSTTSPASAWVFKQMEIVNRFLSNLMPASRKWLLSLKSTTKTAISGRPMMKFESGYTVETVFDGNKLGIEPYSVEVLPNGELLILDSANSNIYRISSSLSLYTRPKLLSGSPDGYSGHVDGKLREAKMNHPKGIAVDDRGNIYVADNMNMAVRKISDKGVTTIAGGEFSQGGGHMDGPSEDAKFSNDFDVVYIGSSCSLLVIDRGHRVIREIQLHFDDCAYRYGSGFPFGLAVLGAAGLVGYFLALLHRRLGSILSSQDVPIKMTTTASLHQRPVKSVRPPLIPTEEHEKQEESLFGSLSKLFVSAWESALDILAAVFSGFKMQQQHRQQHGPQKTWPVQESFIIPDEDEPPSIDTRAPTPRKTYPFMSKDAEKMQHQLRQSRPFYGGWDAADARHQKYQHHHQYQPSTPHMYYEKSHEKTNEIAFGAVQDLEEKRKPTVVKPVDYGNLVFDHQNIRYRMNSSYPHGFL